MASKSVVNNGSLFRFREVFGDLFSSPETSSLAHCISEDCKMGSGIAVAFKESFGHVQEIRNESKRTGDVAILKVGRRFIYYLVTKPNYWDKPTYKTLESSLLAMKKHCKENEVKELSMPKIGCGLDRLSWGAVSGMIMDIFQDTDMSITIYDIGSKGGQKRRKSKNDGQNQDWRTNSTSGDRSGGSSYRNSPYQRYEPRNPKRRGPRDEHNTRPVTAPDFKTQNNSNQSGNENDRSNKTARSEPVRQKQEDYFVNRFDNHNSKEDDAGKPQHLPVGLPKSWVLPPKNTSKKGRRNHNSQEPLQDKTNPAPQADKTKASQSGKFHEGKSGASKKSRAENLDKPQAVSSSQQQTHVGQQTTEPLLEGNRTNRNEKSKKSRGDRSNDTNKTRAEGHSEPQNCFPQPVQESCAETHQQQKGKQQTKKRNSSARKSQQTEVTDELQKKAVICSSRQPNHEKHVGEQDTEPLLEENQANSKGKSKKSRGNRSNDTNKTRAEGHSEPQNCFPQPVQESCAETHQKQKGKQEQTKKPNNSTPKSQQTAVTDELQEKAVICSSQQPNHGKHVGEQETEPLLEGKQANQNRNSRKGKKNTSNDANTTRPEVLSEPQDSFHEPVQESCAETHQQHKGKQMSKKPNSSTPKTQQTEVTNELQEKDARKPVKKSEPQAQNISKKQQQQQKQEIKNKERTGETHPESGSQSISETHSKKPDSDSVATVNSPVDPSTSREQQQHSGRKGRNRRKNK